MERPIFATRQETRFGCSCPPSESSCSRGRRCNRIRPTLSWQARLANAALVYRVAAASLGIRLFRRGTTQKSNVPLRWADAEWSARLGNTGPRPLFHSDDSPRLYVGRDPDRRHRTAVSRVEKTI